MIDKILIFICIAIAFFVIVFIYAIIAQIAKKRHMSISKGDQDRYIQKNGITVTRDLQYNGPLEKCRFIVDDVEKAVYVSSSQSDYQLVKIPYSQLINVHKKVTYTEDGSMGGAILGGLVAGGIGSYLGATRGRHYICSYIVELNLRNIAFPIFQMVLFENAKFDADSAEYREADQFASELKGIVNAIRCVW